MKIHIFVLFSHLVVSSDLSLYLAGGIDVLITWSPGKVWHKHHEEVGACIEVENIPLLQS
ncbi:hypothetical protein ZOSMA_101G00530 [Zostera marina]|uniref:Uncharacterized protein n=1 Tax=Zostera marina TaxID=29655 RepID=A0A0K9Q5K1_ZOSMR|nr:hypothetical protein ZOSMA_101G00530 [Zostera marina]